MSRLRLLLVISVLVVGGILAGCMQGEQTTNDIDVPENTSSNNQKEASQNNNLENNDDSEGNEENDDVTETEETVQRELYLLDENNLVVPQTLELPKSDSAATQVMEYLVKDGPVTELLPSGFEAVLPADTEILSVNLEEESSTLVVDVSEDFKNYDAEQELQIIQAMTHTLTQFDSVDKVKLWINGEEQNAMPVDNTPLSEGYSRANGINLDVTNKPDLQMNEAATIFYPKEYDDGMHFVPVTKYIQGGKSENTYSSIVQALLEGPSHDIMIKDVFNDGTVLKNNPSVKDGVLELEFSESILKEEEPVIANDTSETLIRTLTELEDVEAVQISVENQKVVSDESGRSYDNPVTIQDFESKEKM